MPQAHQTENRKAIAERARGTYKEPMRVLGIETSCDETGVAIYDGEAGLMAHALYSQAHIHAEYGGVVPEIASRDHVRKLVPLLDECLDKAGSTRAEIDGVEEARCEVVAGCMGGAAQDAESTPRTVAGRATSSTKC